MARAVRKRRLKKNAYLIYLAREMLVFVSTPNELSTEIRWHCVIVDAVIKMDEI